MCSGFIAAATDTGKTVLKNQTADGLYYAVRYLSYMASATVRPEQEASPQWQPGEATRWNAGLLSTTDEKWLFRNLGGAFHASGLITLCLSSSNPARPYIWRFSIFRRFTWPSTTPLLQRLLIASHIAVASASIPAATRRMYIIRSSALPIFFSRCHRSATCLA